MRLDKFLKVARVIKRRTLAKEISDDGRVKVNDRAAKAGTVLSVGDIVEIEFGRKIVTLKVMELGAHAKKEDAERMYEIIKEQKIERDSDFL
ncbi:RNA-binding S4 domain-containing protein [Salinicoccus jeotgali]|uniref:RQC P-site tRNA stabilizing factor n=1 Tax=Salinicoccus jeotgali TaxID=381634 RepID=A0ABP7F815_9STAP